MRILRRFPLSKLCDDADELNALLLEFLLQLRLERPRFEVFGSYVAFDMRLIMRLGAMTISTMLVLIQFQLSETNSDIPETLWLPLRV